MTWFGWLLLVGWCLEGLGYVAIVGKRREPVSPMHATFEVAWTAFMIWGLLVVGTAHR